MQPKIKILALITVIFLGIIFWLWHEKNISSNYLCLNNDKQFVLATANCSNGECTSQDRDGTGALKLSAGYDTRASLYNNDLFDTAHSWCVKISQKDAQKFLSYLPQQEVYTDDRLSVTYSNDWTAQQPKDDQGNLISGLQLIKNGYTLSLLTHEQMASGIIGGRWRDIYRYTTNIDTVDGANCVPFSWTTKISDTISRVDLFLDTAKMDNIQKEACGQSTSKGVIWYGSYFTENCSIPQSLTSSYADTCNGYYINFDDLLYRSNQALMTGSQEYLVFAISANAKSVNDLPLIDDKTFQDTLNSATEIIKGIEWQQ
ncbi:MAG: hypothetical protein V1664_01355 [Candidatus Uhrbacteria bacterium]